MLLNTIPSAKFRCVFLGTDYRGLTIIRTISLHITKFTCLFLCFLYVHHANGQLYRYQEKVRNGDSVWMNLAPYAMFDRFYIGEKRVPRNIWEEHLSQFDGEVASLIESAINLRTTGTVTNIAGSLLFFGGLMWLLDYGTDVQSRNRKDPSVPALAISTAGIAIFITGRILRGKSNRQYGRALLLYNEAVRLPKQPGISLRAGMGSSGYGLLLNW